jgi:uncharacterized repeat protein (TIGR03803 family)
MPDIGQWFLYTSFCKEDKSMKRDKFWTALSRVLAVVTVALFVISVLAPGASAATEKVLYSFTGGSDGQTPHEGLIWDQAGNLYSATLDGGVGKCQYWGGTGCGVVYQLAPNGDGTWTENVLYSFKGGKDGSNPEWGSLTFDNTGNLYGTTQGGGKYGQGTVFELTPNAQGKWTKSVLYDFKGKSDGHNPTTTLIFVEVSRLVGTTDGDGTHGGGTVFELTPGSGGHWTFRALHQFARNHGFYPWVGLIPGPDGAYYGTTRDDSQYCGRHDCGTVYRLAPASGGKWTYQVLHQFQGGTNGADPFVGGLAFDEQGNLFGQVQLQGAYGYGLIFELTPATGGKWTYQVVYQFTGSTDGGNPAGGLVFDTAGDLYGTAWAGGAYTDGVLFKLTPSQDGAWTESVAYDFDGTDGANPGAALTWDSAGNIYGIATAGGAYGYGAVYEITP